ncbi:hypothetical protein ALC60_04948 [Trachymyrmex zeteki]|uniref:Uncharacterized protein n=1 Tax=Mycetomoellerius zeteki TaxID=64791 RepID=A0A151X6V9_9HYME|nr:hypothetical protein ALC60_04948 [Trachymyrmex zeteki]
MSPTDKVLADNALGRIIARDSILNERAGTSAIWAAMNAKTKVGIGMKPKMRKKTKKRILPMAKRVIAVNDSKAARRQLEELQRHYRAMEQGRGLYLAPYKYRLYLSPYKRGQVVAAKKKNVEETIKMPSGAATNVQLDELARRNESDIVNLDDATVPGTHWVMYAKRNNRVVYIESFGKLRPSKELVRYFGNGVTTIEYDRMSYQTYNQSFCGQMCMRFLRTADVREFK